MLSPEDEERRSVMWVWCVVEISRFRSNGCGSKLRELSLGRD